MHIYVAIDVWRYAMHRDIRHIITTLSNALLPKNTLNKEAGGGKGGGGGGRGGGEIKKEIGRWSRREWQRKIE